MTIRKDLKTIIRDRCKKTGESYTTARAHVLRERAARLASSSHPERTDPDGSSPPPTEPTRAEAVVLKVNQRSARIRILGEDTQITFRSSDVHSVVPGHLVTIAITKRWPWHGDAYASGRIKGARIAIHELGLEPLPLDGGELEDLRHEPRPGTQPDDALWLRNTAYPRPCFEMHPIAWGELSADDPDDNPTCIAADLAYAGKLEEARRVLMDALCTDLRCIDAHAHLGNLEFDAAPRHAMLHYEVGIRVGELSLPPGFDGALPWARMYNRPFLRCLHGYGLCLWRLGELARAQAVFERVLALNPVDNQGVRFSWNDVCAGRSWEQAQERERQEDERQARRPRPE